jgi:hypothetical protein
MDVERRYYGVSSASMAWNAGEQPEACEFTQAHAAVLPRCRPCLVCDYPAAIARVLQINPCGGTLRRQGKPQS